MPFVLEKSDFNVVETARKKRTIVKLAKLLISSLFFGIHCSLGGGTFSVLVAKFVLYLPINSLSEVIHIYKMFLIGGLIVAGAFFVFLIIACIVFTVSEILKQKRQKDVDET